MKRRKAAPPESTTETFRAQLSAAPLKLRLTIPAHNPIIPFRAQLSAAPLKHRPEGHLGIHVIGIPRSIERGPVEAQSSGARSAFEAKHSALN